LWCATSWTEPEGAVAELGLGEIEPATGSGGPTLTATAGNGIRAEVDHEPWAGVTDLELPWP
jgi:hypothetical protein